MQIFKKWFLKLDSVTEKLLSMFGITWACESILSTTNCRIHKYRLNISGANLAFESKSTLSLKIHIDLEDFTYACEIHNFYIDYMLN